MVRLFRVSEVAVSEASWPLKVLAAPGEAEAGIVTTPTIGVAGPDGAVVGAAAAGAVVTAGAVLVGVEVGRARGVDLAGGTVGKSGRVGAPEPAVETFGWPGPAVAGRVVCELLVGVAPPVVVSDILCKADCETGKIVAVAGAFVAGWEVGAGVFGVVVGATGRAGIAVEAAPGVTVGIWTWPTAVGLPAV